MRKLQRKILAVLCAGALLASSLEIAAFAEELSEEPKEIVEETVEEEAKPEESESKEETESEEPKAEEENQSEEPEAEEAELEGPTVIEENLSEESEAEEKTESEEPEVEEETESEEPVKEEKTVPEEQIKEEEIEKKISIRSEISDNAKAGDIFRLVCDLEGYEEGTYELQWQYMTTDWHGNYIGEWTDLSGENGMELEVIINEKNALRAWRVVVNEI